MEFINVPWNNILTSNENSTKNHVTFAHYTGKKKNMGDKQSSKAVIVWYEDVIK